MTYPTRSRTATGWTGLVAAGECSGKKGINHMTASTQTEAVLAHVDAGLNQSLERLYALLRIKSISTDPAYAEECQRAADWIAKPFDADALLEKIGRAAGRGNAHHSPDAGGR